jgi:hypothetical protein
MCAIQIRDAQHKRHSLCKDGGKGRSGDPPLKNHHEKDHEDSVKDSRYHDEVKWGFGIAQTAQDGADGDITEKEEHTPEGDLKEDNGLW